MADKIILDDETDVRYFEDPVLTFDNSIVYGCHLDMDFATLKTWCDTGFKNLMIF